MNAKLKELKLMALEKFASNHGLKLTHLGDLDPKSQEEVDSLFSELILRECISSIYGSDISDKKQERLVNGLAYKFGFLGVEE